LAADSACASERHLPTAARLGTPVPHGDEEGPRHLFVVAGGIRGRPVLTPSPDPTRSPPEDSAATTQRLALALILAFGAALRLYHVTDPFLDAHAWRQLDTAAMARNFYDGPFFPLDPRVDWGGAHGYLEAEFPLVPAVIAVLYRLFGVHEILGRFVIIASSLTLIWAVYRLALAMDGRPAVARGAAFLMAVSPAAVFFGRIVIPDTPMICLSVIALLGFIEFAQRDSRAWLVTGASALAVACLLKLPAIFLGPPILTALVAGRGWRVLRDPRVWMAGVLPLALTAAWYWHAHLIFERTGLTMGILGAPTKFYPAYVSPGPWPSIYSKWSTTALLADYGFYERMFVRFYHFLLLPVGFCGAVLGGVTWRGRGAAVLAVWLAANVVFLFIAGEVHRVHEYYQLPFVVIGAIYFGAAAWPLFDAAWIRSRFGARAGGMALEGVVLALLALASVYCSSVTQAYFAPRGMAERMLQAGAAIDRATADNDLAIVVDDYGIMSPILLYFTHLKGWSFDVGDLTPQVVDNLRRLGARYFVTTQWSHFKQARPEAAAYLERYRVVDVPGAPGDTVMMELR
jgi:4-amino-4-deoxy-L-arabinose transferase-like glycosyltransferase